MTNKDYERFAIMMATLETCFDKVVSKEKIKLYYNFLDDLSIQQMDRAITWLLNTHKYFPTISDIRTATLESVESLAFKAWATVYKVGGKLSHMPDTGDPVTEMVIDKAFGGWENFCWYKELDEFTKSQDRRHFIQAYKLFHNELERKNLLVARKPKQLKGKK